MIKWKVKEVRKLKFGNNYMIFIYHDSKHIHL